jgi:hypothetical protein
VQTGAIRGLTTSVCQGVQPDTQIGWLCHISVQRGHWIVFYASMCGTVRKRDLTGDPLTQQRADFLAAAWIRP